MGGTKHEQPQHLPNRWQANSTWLLRARLRSLAGRLWPPSHSLPISALSAHFFNKFEPVCICMNFVLLSVSTASQCQSFCNRLWRPLLAERQNTGFFRVNRKLRPSFPHESDTRSDALITGRATFGLDLSRSQGKQEILGLPACQTARLVLAALLSAAGCLCDEEEEEDSLCLHF